MFLLWFLVDVGGGELMTRGYRQNCQLKQSHGCRPLDGVEGTLGGVSIWIPKTIEGGAEASRRIGFTGAEWGVTYTLHPQAAQGCTRLESLFFDHTWHPR